MRKILTPPEPKDEQLYTVLMIAMILSIVVVSAGTYYFRTTLYERDDWFSEVYFIHPEGLPNRIDLNRTYEFTFGIRSHEEEVKNFTYVAGIELYNLYSQTESKYSCLREFRRTYFLDWTNETNNISFVSTEPQIPALEPMVVNPDTGAIINWTSYNMEVRFSPPTGRGQLVFFFTNGTDTKYTLTFDDAAGEVLFNGRPQYEGLNMTQGNNRILLSVSGRTIRVDWNGEQVVETFSDDLQHGTFGIYTQDTYATIQHFTVYRESPYVVPDQGTVLNFRIDDGVLWRKYNELRDRQRKSTRIVRDFLETEPQYDCEKDPFYCEFYNLPNDISFELQETNLTKIIDNIPNPSGIYLRMYPIDRQKATVNWTSYSINFEQEMFEAERRGSVVLKMNNNWGVMITKNNSYFIQNLGNHTEIDEIRNPNMTSPNIKVRVEVTPVYTHLLLNNNSVFIRDSVSNHSNAYPELFIKDDLLDVSPITITREEQVCEEDFSFEFCEIELQLSTSRNVRRTQEAEYEIETVEYEKTSTSRSVPLIPRQNWTDVDEISIPVFNPYIPDRKLTFNSRALQIFNESNYSMEFGYQGLDGARVIEAGIRDRDSNLLSVFIMERENRILIYRNNSLVDEVRKFVNKSESHRAKIDVVDGDGLISFDNRIIAGIEDFHANNASFYLGSRNTYAELYNVYITKEGYGRSVDVGQNPCDLRRIYTGSTTHEVWLEPTQSINVTSSFNVGTDFDYGKVFVELYGSSNTTGPLEVHFWVIKDE